MELGTRKNLIDGSICSRSCTRGIWISISDLSLNWMPHCSRRGPMPIHAQRIRRYCSVFCLTFIVHQLWMNSGFMFDFLSWYSWTVRSLIKSKIYSFKASTTFSFPNILSCNFEQEKWNNTPFKCYLFVDLFFWVLIHQEWNWNSRENLIIFRLQDFVDLMINYKWVKMYFSECPVKLIFFTRECVSGASWPLFSNHFWHFFTKELFSVIGTYDKFR